MTRRHIATNRAPAAIGPYSQAIDTGSFVFCSGQVGLDPATGDLVPGGVEPEVKRALDNLSAVLDAAGVTFADVVKTTVFLADLAAFATMNGIYGGYFPDPPPARSTFQVAGLPKGARVEIEAIAIRSRG